MEIIIETTDNPKADDIKRLFKFLISFPFIKEIKVK